MALSDDKLQKLQIQGGLATNRVTGTTRTQRIEEEAARKRLRLGDGKAANVDDYVTLNPFASQEEIQNFGLERNYLNQKQELLKTLEARRFEQHNPYDFSELAGDTANSIAKGVLAAGEVAYGAGNLLSKYNVPALLYNNLIAEEDDEQISLDNLTGGFSQNFAESRNILDGMLQSENQTADMERIERYGAEFTAKSDEQTKAEIEAGNSEWFAEAKNIGRKALDTAERYLRNPAVVAQQVVEEVPSLITAGAIGKVAATGVGKQAAAKQATKRELNEVTDLLKKQDNKAVVDRYLKSKAGKEKVGRAAEAAGVTQAAVGEAMSNAIQTKGEILGLTEQALAEGSPAYNEMRASGLSHEQARMRLSEQAFDIVVGLTLPLAAVSSKVSGAGKLEGTLFLKGSEVSKPFLKVAGATAIEGLEEAFQGGTGQAVQNFATRETADSTQSLTEGVGEAIGESAVVGAGTGVAITGITTAPEIFSATAKDVKKLANQADKGIKLAANSIAKATDPKVVKDAIKSGNASEILNTESKTYNPEDAIKVLQSQQFFPVKEENESDTDFGTRSQRYIEELVTHGQKYALRVMEKNKDLDPTSKEAIKNMSDLKRTTQIVNGLKAQVGIKDFRGAIAALKTDPENAAAVKEILLGSMQSVTTSPISVEQAQEIIDSGELTENEIKKAKIFIKSKNNQSEVSNAIKNGDKGRIGLNQHTELITSTVDQGDKKTARTLLNNLSKFNKSQNDKAIKTRQAFDKVRNSDNPNIAINISGDTWKFNITKKTPESFINNIETDNQAVTETFKSLRDYAVSVFIEGKNNNVRAENTGSTESTTTDSTRSQSTDGVSNRNETEIQPDNRVSRESGVFVEQDGTGTVERTANDNALSEGEQAQTTATQEDSAGEPEANTLTPFNKIMGESGNNDSVNQLQNSIQEFETLDNFESVETLEEEEALEAQYITNIENVIESVKNVNTDNYGQPIKDMQADIISQLELGMQDVATDVVEEAANFVREIRDIDNSNLPLTQKGNRNAQNQQRNTETQTTPEQTTLQEENQENTNSEPTGRRINPDNLRTNSVGETIEIEGDPVNSSYLTNKIMNSRIGKWFRAKKKVSAFNKVDNFFDKYDTIEGLNDEDRVNLARVKVFVQKFADTVDSVVGMKPEAGLQTHLAQLLMNEGSTTYKDGLDPNVMNAIALGAFNWIGSRGRQSLTRTENDIRETVGVDDTVTIPQDVANFYIDKGIPSFLVEAEMGKYIADVLGLSIDPNSEAPVEAREKLELSLGGMAYLTLEKMGMIETRDDKGKYLYTTAPKQDAIDGFYQEKTSKGALTDFRHTKLVENNRTASLENLFTALAEPFEKMLEIDYQFKQPSFEPKTKPPTMNNRGNTKLSNSQKEGIDKYNKRKWKMNPLFVEMVEILGDDVLRDVMGYDFSLIKNTKTGKVSSNKTHAVNLAGAEGKNNGIDRSLNNLKNFVNHLTEKGLGYVNQTFHFNTVVDSTGRNRMDNKLINPQTDKLHRNSMIMEGWDYSVNNIESRNFFKLAVAQAFGVSIDKLSMEESLKQVNNLFDSNTVEGRLVQNAVQAIRKLRSTEAKTEDEIAKYRKAIQTVVNPKKYGYHSADVGGEGAHTLAGLMAMVDYSATKPFNANLSLEIDGLTNGTALALLMFAPSNQADQDTWLARTGIFTNGMTSFAQYKEQIQGAQDNYEALASRLSDNLTKGIEGQLFDNFGKQLLNQDLIKVIRPIGNILAKLNNKNMVKFGLVRSVAKNPVMIGNYGAGVTKVVQEFSQEVINNFYDTIETAVADNDFAKLVQLNDELSRVVLGDNYKGNGVGLIYIDGNGNPRGKNWKQAALNFTLNSEDSNKFRLQVTSTFGAIMRLSMEQEFGEIREERSKFNTLINAHNALFRAAYDTEVEKAIAENSESILTFKKKQEILKKIAKFKPEIKHVQSEDMFDQMPVTTEIRVDSRNAAQAVEVPKVSDSLPNSPIGNNLRTYAQTQTFTSNGAKGTVYAVQSTESGIVIEVLKQDAPVLQVYDGLLVNPNNAIEVAQIANKATIDLSKKGNLYKDLANSVQRAIRGLPNEYLELANIYLKDEINHDSKKETPMDVVKNALINTVAIQQSRADLYGRIKAVNQYAFPSGEHSLLNETEETNQSLVNDFVLNIKNKNGVLNSSPEGETPNGIEKLNTKLNLNNIVGLLNSARSSSTTKSSNGHFAYLQELLGDTYNGFITELKLKVSESNAPNSGVYDFTAKEIRTNVNTGHKQSPTEMGQDEILAHEVVHSITKNALETNNILANEIRKLMKQAKAKITPKDFEVNGLSSEEALIAYNYIFENPNKTIKGYSVGVHEFVAYGLTNEHFMNLLRDKVDTNYNPNGVESTVVGKLRAFYSKMVNMFSDKLRKTNNLTADKKLLELTRQLMQNELNAKQRIVNTSLVEKFEEGTKTALLSYIQRPILALLNADVLTRNTDNKLLTVAQGLAAIGRITATGQVGEFRKQINKVMNRLGATENNLLIALMNEIQGRTDENNRFYELAREARKLIDQARADTSVNIKRHVRKQFGKELTSDEEKSLTRVLLKTDLSSLTQKYGAEDIHKLITDTDFLTREIKKTHQELRQFGNNTRWYIRQAQSLGHFMVNNQFTESFGLMNAHAISRKVGLNSSVPTNASQAEPIIDRLATLTALRVTAKEYPADMKRAVTVFEEEFTRSSDPEENGIIFTLMNHVDYKKRASEQLFNNNPMLVEKGYIREIYNPNKSFKVAPTADIELMGKDGFTAVGTVGKDASDPNTTSMTMYVTDMGALAPWQAGGVSIAGMTNKGTKYFNTVAQTTIPNSHKTAVNATNTMKQNKLKDAQNIYNGTAKTQAKNSLVPLLDDQGNVSDYRYVMQEKTKDLLDVNIQLSDVLGAMEGNMKSKVAGTEINSKYVEALVEDYNTNFKTDPERYVFVGLNSDRADLEELYKMMPSDMRAQIKAATGQDGIFVKQDIVKLVFGQRKFSIPHYFREKQRLNDLNGKLGNMYLSKVYRTLGSPKAAHIEQSWQEVISFVKDTIVVKSIVTLLANIASNNVLLWSMGVGFKDILVQQERAVKFAEKYQEDKEKIDEISRNIVVNQNKKGNRTALIAKLQAEKTKLEDELITNPVHDLIEAGVYQSIIEDIDMLDDEFSYSTKLEDWLEPVTSKIPKQLKTVGNTVLINQGTPLYELLRRSTQLSDFAARFALHEHNKNKGMDAKDSINMVVDTFIDYDLPTHKGIEYLNSMGGIFFTKFFLRIQKVILNTLVNSPARFIGLYELQDLFGGLSDITDSFILTKDIGFMFKDPIEALSGYFDTHPLIQLLK